MKYPICVALCVIAGWAGAAEVYKFVDENGNVTYSARPPLPDEAQAIEKVELRGELTEEQKAHADEQEEALRTRSTALGEELAASIAQQREREQEIQEARAEVHEAEIGLLSALDSKKQYSEERVHMANEVLRQKRQRLSDLQSGVVSPE